MQDPNLKTALKDWRATVKKYQKPDTQKAIVQLLNSFLPFLGLLVLMYISLEWSYLLTLALAVIAAFFLVRIFIVQHDCGHQSFLKSRKWNQVIGFFSSLFSTIPYQYWRHSHNEHHAHNGQLEHRGRGDIYFLTTEEYGERSSWGKWHYRLFRSPVVQFVCMPMIYLAFSMRYPFMRLKQWKRIRWSHFFNNLLLVLVYGTLAFVLGWQKVLLVHLPVLLSFGTIAFWFFYIQHQHEENYNRSQQEWDFLTASIQGSTFYKLPRMFQWLTGNIGFHHIHHLNARIPNYNLETCARENPCLNEFVHTLNFQDSLKCIHHKLWDEKQQRMISFREFEK